MIPFFTEASAWADRWLVAVGSFALRATVLLLAAWLATRLLRSAAAATRHLVWTVAVAGVLLLPLAGAVLPPWTVPITTVRVSAGTVPAPVAVQRDAAPAVEHSAAPRQPAPAPNVGAATLPQRAAAVGQLVPDLSATALAIAVWLALALLLIARLGVANTRISAWRRAARPVEDADVLRLLRRLSARHGIERPVALLESDETDVPITWGVVYPVILLPAAAAQWDEDQRTAVLMHELAHVKRFDALTQQLAQLALALLWFHPLMWLALRRLRVERERACDDVVLAAGARASRYADQLLGFARRLTGRGAPSVAALAMARRTELEGRLLAILDPAVKRSSVRRTRAAAMGAAALLLVVPLAAFRPGARIVTEPAAPGPVARTAALAVDSIATTAPAAATPVAKPVPPAAAAPALPDIQFDPRRIAPSLVASAQALTLIPLALRDSEPPSPVDLATLVEVTRAARRLSSDHDKAQILKLVARRYVRSDSLRDAYLDVVATITSDHDRGVALLALLARDTLTAATAPRVVRIIATITSDYGKGQVLRRLPPALIADSATQRAYLGVLAGMSSSVERAGAIMAFAQHPNLAPPHQLALLQATSGITSNVEKANALLAFLQHQGIDDAQVRRAFLDVAGTLTSDVEYRRVVTAVMR